jgi:sulfur transfer complex TusBCD TusB component (DsrH family)
MPLASQARLEFRLNICFRQLLHAQELAFEYGDPGMCDDLRQMAQHVHAMHEDLLARTRRKKIENGPIPNYRNK